jgi:hypothetical protein
VRILAAPIAALAAAAPATADVSAPRVSANWSGYAVAAAGVSFRDVTGSWVQPRATCTPGRASASAFWVGIGGLDRAAAALPQLGTEADCDARGRATYRAWWQVAPAARVAVALRVAPGDRIVAAVLVDGRRVTLTLKNATHGTRFSRTVTAARAPDVGSAEWIVEAPSTAAPLADFGTVAFSRATAIGNGHAGPIDDPAWSATAIALDSRSAVGLGRYTPVARHELFGGLPSGLTDDGGGFAVAVQTTEG